ncbi:MAG: hypothetical protein PHF42_09550 [Pseudomonas sp.]|nr:hypothetical protein [Pseudomonas sp.]
MLWTSYSQFPMSAMVSHPSAKVLLVFWMDLVALDELQQVTEEVPAKFGRSSLHRLRDGPILIPEREISIP